MYRAAVSGAGLAIMILTTTAFTSAPASSPSGGDQLGATSHASLTWGSCPAGMSKPLECATVRVPLDYRDPAGSQIGIAVSRLRATNPKHRRGVFLLNPGGPGGAGLDMPLMISGLAPQSVTDSYDLIGFDPRGTGRSTPVTCALSPQQQDPTKIIPYPAPDGDISASSDYARQVAAQCFRHSAAELPFVTTANTARDMDRIRVALGEKKVSYLGYSYGTYLGAVYVSLFPAHTDRIILDSNVDPTRLWYRVWQAWGPANEIRFPDFARWAATRAQTYELGTTPLAVRRTYFTLAAMLDKHPMTTPQGPYTGNRFRAFTRTSLYNETAFPVLAKVWQAVERGDPPGVVAAQKASPPPVPPQQSQIATLWGITCDDVAWPRPIAEYQKNVLSYRRRYPITNGMPSNLWPCAFWPAAPRERPVSITDRGPVNVLLLQNLRDPATPYFGAVHMRTALGDRARMISVDQGGHGVYLITQNACASDYATAFLVHGTLPRADAYCTAGTARITPNVSTRGRQDVIRQLRSRQFPL